jgi:hypothetical protein
MASNNCYSVVMYVSHMSVADGKSSSYYLEKKITAINSKQLE